jgi:hypothetical protein
MQISLSQDYETFKATMSKEEILIWFHKRLSRAPEPADLFQVD